jgi:formylglycine-generating enzyme required for sulfatase activity
MFDGCMRGMKWINNKKGFLLGPAQHNIFEGITVDIGDFFIDKTPITVKEYKKFLSILHKYLEKKRMGICFLLQMKICAISI